MAQARLHLRDGRSTTGSARIAPTTTRSTSCATPIRRPGRTSVGDQGRRDLASHYRVVPRAAATAPTSRLLEETLAPRGYARGTPITSGSSPARAIHAVRIPSVAPRRHTAARCPGCPTGTEPAGGRSTHTAGA